MKTIFYWVVHPLWRPVYLLSLILDTVAVCSLIWLLSLWDRRGSAVYSIGRCWSLLNISLLGTRLKLLGGDKIVRGRPYRVMAYHQRLFDVWALIGCLPLQLRRIVKAEIRKGPLFGLTLARRGRIYIDRQKRKVACHRLAAVKAALEANLDLRYGALN